MKLNNALTSTHTLKKCTYRMLRKLHSLEYRGSLRTCRQLSGEYYVVLYLRHISQVIGSVYSNVSNADVAVENLENLIKAIETAAASRLRIDRTLLVACLKRHTKVFNWLEEHKIKIEVNDELIEFWNMKCVIAYICQFGNKI